MKVIVTNKHGDPVYRLGIEFPPHDDKEIELDNPQHLRILNACRHLEAVEVKPKTKKAK
jgi:hypothetical protein